MFFGKNTTVEFVGSLFRYFIGFLIILFLIINFACHCDLTRFLIRIVVFSFMISK